jgi:hypothetical protein
LSDIPGCSFQVRAHVNALAAAFVPFGAGNTHRHLQRRNGISRPLGCVELFVGAPDELVWRVVGVEFGQPDAHRRGNGRRPCKFLPNFISDCACRSSRDTGHKDRKFIATETADHVCSAYASTGDVHQVLQRLIANVMTVAIIDRFEIIDIENGNILALS